MAMAWRGLAQRDPDRYALSVANQILGGGMSSRLFQEVREERGLAYTVFTSPSSYADAGVLVLYAGTTPARLGELLDVVADVIDGVVADGITDAELEVAKGYLEGATLLGLEDSGSRMAPARRGAHEPRRDHPGGRAPRAHPRRDDCRRAPRAATGPRRAGSLSIVGPFHDDEPVLVGAVDRAARRVAS